MSYQYKEELKTLGFTVKLGKDERPLKASKTTGEASFSLDPSKSPNQHLTSSRKRFKGD
jgi:hypothetical protein